MRITFRKIRKLLLAAALICCAVIFASCGAVVDTEFTADNNFAGARVITLTLSNNDLSEYVTGGKDSLEATIKKHIPDCLTYTITEGEDNLVCKFTLSFTGIDDYKAKIGKVLAAEIDDPVTAEIEYENTDSPFKSGLKFNENYNSMDLIGWLRYGLQQDGIVTESNTSNWFENGDTTVTINGKEYDSYNSISVYDSAYYTPDNIQVKTYFLTNGNFDRRIEFYFNNDTLTDLSEQGVNVEEFLSSRAPSSVVEKSAQDYKTVYSVKMNNLTAEQITAETAKVLQYDETAFEVSVNPDVNVSRRMLISVNEKLNASYYLKNDRYLESIYFLYSGAQPSQKNNVSMSYYRENDNIGYSYIPDYVGEEKASTSFVWDVDFEYAGAVLDFAGNNVNFDINMYAATDMLPDAKQILNNALTEAVPDGAKLTTAEKDGMTVYTVDFGTKAPEDEAALYREFVYNYTGEKTECKFSLTDGVSKSPFKTVTSYSAVVDMSDLSDDIIDFTFRKNGSLYILDNSQVKTYEELVNMLDKEYEETEISEEAAAQLAEYREKAESADYTGVFEGTLRFYAIEESVNVAAIIFLIILIVCIIGLVAMVAFNVKTWLEAAKNVSVKPIAIQAPAGFAVIAQNSAQAEDDEDEEEYV